MGLIKRVSNLIRGDRHIRDIADELAFHIEMRTEDNIRRGMSPVEAKRDAERRFGNWTLAAERTRDTDILGWLDRLTQDVRYTLRAFRSSRGTVAVLIASLALGIGANTAMFTLVYALLMRPLPVQDPGALYSVVLGNFCSCGWVERDGAMNYALWDELRREQRVFTNLFAYAPKTLDVSHGGEMRLIAGAYASSEMWSVLNVRPLLGRAIAAEDEKVGSASAVAVISEAFWESEYDRDPGAIGRTVVLGGRPFTIIGVAPRRFFGMYVGERVDVYLPLEASASLESGNPLANARWWWLTVVGRLRGELTAASARNELSAFSPLAMQRTIPADFGGGQADLYLRQYFEVSPAATGLSDARSALTRPLLIASALLAVLLLLACANVATLQLSRGLGRQREFAVRIALGASRTRLGSQVFLESLLAAVLGAALGVALSGPTTRLVAALYSTDFASLKLDLRPDGYVIAFAVTLAVLTSVLFGLAPAVQATRTDPHGILKAVRASNAAEPFRQWLLGIQVALAVVLASGAVLFAATLRNLTGQDIGFRPRNVLVMHLDTERAQVAPQERASLYRLLLDRLRDLPGVESVAASYVTPLSGSAWQNDLTVVTDGAGVHSANAHFHVVTPEYFRTYDTPVIEGRPLSESDSIGAPQAVLVNRAFVRNVLGRASVLGRRIRCELESLKLDAEIVGIVVDAKYRDLRSTVPPTVYVPMAQDPAPPAWLAVSVRTRGAPAEAVPGVRRAVAATHPKVAYLIRPFESYVADAAVNERAMAVVSGLFGVLALLIASVGIYGLAAYSVTQRRTEIGIRIALGATAGRVVRMLFTQTGLTVTAGILAGSLCAAWASRLTDTIVFGVTPGAVWVYGCAAAALFVAAAVAMIGPSLHAARVDPIEALRTH